MRELVAEALQAYREAGLDCGEKLLPPADAAAVESMAATLSLPIPEELRALYAVHGGQAYIPPGVTGLFGSHRLHSPAEVVEHHRTYVENGLDQPGVPIAFPPIDDEPGWWVRELIPFASWDVYALCIHATTGEVWEFEPVNGLRHHRPSMRAVLEEVIAAVRAGGDPELGETQAP